MGNREKLKSLTQARPNSDPGTRTSEANAPATAIEAVVVDSDSDDARPAPSASSSKQPDIDTDGLRGPQSDPVWDLGGCLLVPGLKHICSNIQGDVLSRLAHYSQFQEDVKALNTLLHQKYYRDRVKQLFDGKATQKLFDHYDGGVLVLWRWGSLVKVCEALHRREGALRESWNLQKFLTISLHGHEQDDAETAPAQSGAGNDDQVTFKKADGAIRSSYFWSYLKFLLIVEGVVEDLSSWTEGCPCHGHAREAHDCALKGRRAPEAACGAFKRFLDTTMATASSMFIAAASGLGHNSKEWHELSADWNTACDLIEAEVEAKAGHWRSLPWSLCAIAVPDSNEARGWARKAIEAFDCVSMEPQHLLARRHRMSQRFLSFNYKGTSPDDVPLRPLLRDFVMGASLDEDNMEPLREWLLLMASRKMEFKCFIILCTGHWFRIVLQ